MCSSDADGDTFSNGDELGDPCCRWGGGSAPADRGEAGQVSHPDFVLSVPNFASCLASPVGANVTLQGLYEGESAAGDGGVTVVLSVPPTASAASDARCMCSVKTRVSSMSSAADVAFSPPVSAPSASLVAVQLSSSQLASVAAVGSTLAVTVTLQSLAAVQDTLSFTAVVQSRMTIPSSATGTSAVTAAPGSTNAAGTFYEINIPVLLPAAVGVVVTVAVVAVLFYAPCVPNSVSSWCSNVRGAHKPQSRGFQVWKALTAVLLLGSTAVSALLYAEMSFVTMADAVLGRALGNTALLLLFASIVSASHHMVLHWAGVSYDRSVFGHMALGTTAIAVSILHGAWMVLSAIIDGLRVPSEIDSGGTGAAWALGHWTTVASVNPLAGTLSGVFGVFLLYFPGRRCARQQAYAFFYMLHVVGAFLTVLFAFLHISHSGLNVTVALVIPSVVIFAERALLAVLHGAALSGRIASAAVVGGDSSAGLVHFTLKQCTVGPAPVPGQWISMVIPSLSLLQHPVSLAGVTACPGDPGSRLLHFIIRSMHSMPPAANASWYHRARTVFVSLFRSRVSWSKKLLAAVSDGTAEGALVLLYDPPLGKHTQPPSALSRTTEHVFFAGGVGVTAVLESAASVALKAGRTATLVWALRETHLAEAGIVLLAELLKYRSATSASKVGASRHTSGEGHQGGVFEMTSPCAVHLASSTSPSKYPTTAAVAPSEPPFGIAAVRGGRLRLQLHLTSAKSAAVAVRPVEAADGVPDAVDAPLPAGATTSVRIITLGSAAGPSTCVGASTSGEGANPDCADGQQHSAAKQTGEASGAQGALTPASGQQLCSDAVCALQAACSAIGVVLEVTVDSSGTRPLPSAALGRAVSAVCNTSEGTKGTGRNDPVCVYVCGPARLSAAVAEAVAQHNDTATGKVGGMKSQRSIALLHVEHFGW